MIGAVIFHLLLACGKGMCCAKMCGSKSGEEEGEKKD